MKKILYLCVILALSTNTMAQFDTSDKNWRSVVNENFDKPGRTWNSSFLSLPPGLYTYPTNDSLFYFSGEIDRYNKHTNSTDKFKYGDCETDEVIASQADLADFYFAVKKSIAVTSTTETVEIGNNDHVIFRFTDSFEITGPFLVDSGGVLTVITQSCPN